MVTIIHPLLNFFQLRSREKGEGEKAADKSQSWHPRRQGQERQDESSLISSPKEETNHPLQLLKEDRKEERIWGRKGKNQNPREKYKMFPRNQVLYDQHFKKKFFLGIPWRRAWKQTPVLLPGEFHGQRRLVGYSPMGHRVRHDSAHTAQHIVALHCCVSFFCTVRWISYMCVRVCVCVYIYKYPHFFLFPSYSDHYRVLNRVSCAIQ